MGDYMATRKVYASYQEIIDLNTIGNTISVIGIHTPTGDTPHKMFPGFFQQYRKWKYLGCSVVGRNAAQLPVDPLGVGYEAGEGNENVMDPRDAFDPIMFHGCHGEDMGQILNKLYFGTDIQNLTDSVSGFLQDQDSSTDVGRADVTEGLYYKALTDRSWRKFNIQSGFILKRLHPMVYNMATNHQISPSMKNGGLQIINGVPTFVGGSPEDNPDILSMDFSIMTNRLQSLGWMDTRVPYIGSTEDLPDIRENYQSWLDFLNSAKNYATMPKLFMGVLLLPMSRRIQQFLRIVITHRFVFAGFRGASMNDNILGSPSFFEMGFNGFGPTDPQDDSTDLGPNPDTGPTPTPSPDPEPVPSDLVITYRDFDTHQNISGGTTYQVYMNNSTNQDSRGLSVTVSNYNTGEQLAILPAVIYDGANYTVGILDGSTFRFLSADADLSNIYLNSWVNGVQSSTRVNISSEIPVDVFENLRNGAFTLVDGRS